MTLAPSVRQGKYSRRAYVAEAIRSEAGMPDEKRKLLEKIHRSSPIIAGKKVLIVDDDMRNIFRADECIMMPEMDGFEAIRRIRTDSQFAALPIIAVTAKAMKADRDQCLEAGASDYISKPVDVNHLVALLRVWLNRQ